MSKRAEQAALKAYPIHGEWVGNQYGGWDEDINRVYRNAFLQGYEQAEKDIIFIIESRLSELLGDAQPTPILRYELQDLIKKIKEENNG